MGKGLTLVGNFRQPDAGGFSPGARQSCSPPAFHFDKNRKYRDSVKMVLDFTALPSCSGNLLAVRT